MSIEKLKRNAKVVGWGGQKYLKHKFFIHCSIAGFEDERSHKPRNMDRL